MFFVTFSHVWISFTHQISYFCPYAVSGFFLINLTKSLHVVSHHLFISLALPILFYLLRIFFFLLSFLYQSLSIHAQLCNSAPCSVPVSPCFTGIQWSVSFTFHSHFVSDSICPYYCYYLVATMHLNVYETDWICTFCYVASIIIGNINFLNRNTFMSVFLHNIKNS